MQFIKIREVKSPERDVNENAGIDFYIPENTEQFRKDLLAKNSDLFYDNYEDILYSNTLRQNKKSILSKNGTIFIAPHHDVIIPSGIMSKFEKNLALIANNKSGIATKKKLIFGASVIDTSYQGEWNLHMINWSDEYQEVNCGQKVIQFIPHIISTDELEIIDKTPEEFYTEKTKRGSGRQGSTGI